jgi:hypothetical protein
MPFMCSCACIAEQDFELGAEHTKFERLRGIVSDKTLDALKVDIASCNCCFVAASFCVGCRYVATSLHLRENIEKRLLEMFV